MNIKELVSVVLIFIMVVSACTMLIYQNIDLHKSGIHKLEYNDIFYENPNVLENNSDISTESIKNKNERSKLNKRR